MKTDEAPVRAGSAPFFAALALLGLFLLLNLGAETKYSSGGKLFAQPRFWPAIGVIGMVVFGVAHLARIWRRGAAGWAGEVLIWLRALEYLIWFMAYVAAVPVIGYLAATICFTLALALRQGYRRGRELLAAIATGIGVVLVFKTALSVWIPGGAVYEYLPGAWRSFMIVNF